MSFSFRPATRQNTPIIVGVAGPTKSGKTYSAHRLARGLASVRGGRVAMLNAEGARGHQYADEFDYDAADIQPPYTPERYTEAMAAVKALKPAALIIDSCSHMHDGPGGLLEYHDAELDKMSKGDDNRRDRMNFAAWIRPKAAENQFIYAMLGLDCPIILCFRAKEKLKIVPGKQPIDLGWQPIAGERITFETLFTLMLPPFSKGVPDLSISEMRKPFDVMIQAGKALDESLGVKLAEWAVGGAVPANDSTERAEAYRLCQEAAHVVNLTKPQWQKLWMDNCGRATQHTASLTQLKSLHDAIALVTA